MTGMIKVSTQELIKTAQSFQTTGTQIQKLTGNMTELVTGLSGQIWTGEAANAYKNKFNGLQDDINRMIKMVNEHVDDLQEMAGEYETAEAENISVANTLSSDVII